MDKEKEKKMLENALKSIEKGQKSREAGYANFKYNQESAVYKAKEKIIEEKGFENAMDYLKTSEGIKNQITLTQENIYAQHKGNFKEGISDSMIGQYIALQMPNVQAYSKEIAKKGINVMAGTEYLEDVMGNNIQMLAQGLDELVSKGIKDEDKSLIMKKIDEQKIFDPTKYNDMDKSTVAQLALYNNKGGTPIGKDIALQFGLKDYLKKEYQK